MNKAASTLAFIWALVTTGCGGIAKPSGAAAFSSIHYIKYFDGITYPYTNSGLAAIIAAAGANSAIIIPPDATVSVTSTQYLVTGQHIFCYPGATFNLNVASGHSFQLTGVSDVHITGCTFSWQSGSTDAIVLANKVSHVSIDRNRFNDFPNGGANSIIFVGDRSNTTLAAQVSDVTLSKNEFYNFAGNGINVQDYATRVAISKNRFITEIAPTNNIIINAQTTDLETRINNLSISDNQMWNGIGGDCIQVQQLAGNIVKTVVVSHNSCMFIGPANGYSMAGIDGLTEDGNILKANGYNLLAGNAVFEAANVTNSIESGNSAILGSQSGDVLYVIFSVIAPNGTTSDNLFTGNKASIQFSGAQTAECWFVGTGGTNSRVLRNTIRDNSCDSTGSTEKTAGMFVQTKHAASEMLDNTVQQNILVGSNVVGDCGLCIENDAGTISDTVIGANQIVNFHLPYGRNFGAQTAAPPWPNGTVRVFDPTVIHTNGPSSWVGSPPRP